VILFRLFDQRFFSPGTAFLAKPEEFDVVIPDEKPVFFLQRFLGFSHEIELLFLEIAIVQDLSASGAYEVVVVIGMVALLIFVAHLAVSGVDLAK
jgi:hypothetical protein